MFIDFQNKQEIIYLKNNRLFIENLIDDLMLTKFVRIDKSDIITLYCIKIPQIDFT